MNRSGQNACHALQFAQDGICPRSAPGVDTGEPTRRREIHVDDVAQVASERFHEEMGAAGGVSRRSRRSDRSSNPMVGETGHGFDEPVADDVEPVPHVEVQGRVTSVRPDPANRNGSGMSEAEFEQSAADP